MRGDTTRSKRRSGGSWSPQTQTPSCRPSPTRPRCLPGPVSPPTRGSPTRTTSARIDGSRAKSPWKATGEPGVSTRTSEGHRQDHDSLHGRGSEPGHATGGIGHAAVTVLLDGKPVGDARGADVGTDGVARFDRSGMLRLVVGAARRRYVLTLVAADPASGRFYSRLARDAGAGLAWAPRPQLLSRQRLPRSSRLASRNLGEPCQ